MKAIGGVEQSVGGGAAVCPDMILYTDSTRFYHILPHTGTTIYYYNYYILLLYATVSYLYTLYTCATVYVS